MKPSPIKHRQAGVELTRGLAAYGVIVIHVGLVSARNPSPAVASLQCFLGLTCVAFFLAASFYFAALPTSKTEDFFPWLKRRAERLLVPYALWSVIYTALQVLEALLRPDRAEGIARVFSDPMGRLLFGGSGVALYFLPLLFVGLVTMKLLTPLFANRSLVVLSFGLFAALLLSQAMVIGGNEFELGTDTAFQPLLTFWLGAEQAQFWARFFPTRLVLVVLALGVRCLPYIFVGWICARFGALLHSSSSRIVIGIVSLLLIVLATLTSLSIPESFLGYSVLLLALVVPVPDRMTWAELLGRYSFGVYLVHQVILEGIKMAARNHPLPMNLATVLPITLATFGLAVLLAYLADKYGGKLGRLLMALPERSAK